MSKERVLLMILDGWGNGSNDPKSNAVLAADTPFIDGLKSKKTPYCQLDASGPAVGLPAGQMGNSEVGHLNIGAGRTVDQPLVKINKAVESGQLGLNPTLIRALNEAQEKGRKLHFMGLLSDGGVHSDINHLKGLCQLAAEKNCPFYVHAFTDGRDTAPKNGKKYLADLQNTLAATNGQLASFVGRYYAMDRDHRWERTAKAWKLLVNGEGKKVQQPLEAIEAAYEKGTTDEFLPPHVCVNDKNQPIATIAEKDIVVFFNFRTDRGRQLTTTLSQDAFPDFELYPLNLHFVTMTVYDENFKNVHPVFRAENVRESLGEVLSEYHKTQLRMAETEKYPHVTYFFSGGQETTFSGEDRKVVNSPKVATYDLKPEMSAPQLAKEAIKRISTEKYDFIILNFANPDMVGHTGVFDAVVKAVKTVDECAQSVTQAALEHGYTCLITADHGNAEQMLDENGKVHTAHTTHLVPFFLCSPDENAHFSLKKQGKLADIAPTVLALLKLPKPNSMNGQSLLE